MIPNGRYKESYMNKKLNEKRNEMRYTSEQKIFYNNDNKEK